MTAIVPASTDDAIDTLLALTLATVAASTQRVYQETFDKWIDWCANHHLSPMSFHPTNIQLFIGDIDGTRKTRQRHLGALLTVDDMLYLDRKIVAHQDMPQDALLLQEQKQAIDFLIAALARAFEKGDLR